MSDLREAFEALEQIDEAMTFFAGKPGHNRRQQIDAIKAALSANGGEVMVFGNGDYTIEVGRYDGQHAVFIAPANPAGTAGELAPPTTGDDKHRLTPGERVMTFPTEAQAFAVAEAIAGRRINRIDGSHPAPPSVAVPEPAVLARAWYHADEDGDYNIYDALNAECPDCIEVIIVRADNTSGPDHIADAGKVVTGGRSPDYYEGYRDGWNNGVDTPSVPEEVLEALWRHTKGVDPETGQAWLTPRMLRESLRLQCRLRTAGDEGEGGPTHNGGESDG